MANSRENLGQKRCFAPREASRSWLPSSPPPREHLPPRLPSSTKPRFIRYQKAIPSRQRPSGPQKPIGPSHLSVTARSIGHSWSLLPHPNQSSNPPLKTTAVLAVCRSRDSKIRIRKLLHSPRYSLSCCSKFLKATRLCLQLIRSDTIEYTLLLSSLGGILFPR